MIEDKWKIFATSSVIAFAAEFFSDLPSAVSRRLMGTSPSCMDASDPHCLHLTNLQFNALSTAYTFSSATAAVIAAVIIEKYGNKGAVWSSTAFMVIGSIFFAAGIYAEDMTAYAILIIGRVLYGLGNGASLTTSNHMINNSWTNNAAPMAWYLLCGRAGSALNYALNGGLLSLIGISGSLWVAVGITGVAGVAGLILGFQDDGSEEKSTEDYSNRRGLWNFLKKAKWIFWTFAMVYFLVHSTISTFTGNGPNLLANIDGRTESEASFIVGLVYDLALLMPLVGWGVDRIGQRDFWMASGTITITIAFAVCYAPVAFPSYALAVLAGLGFAIFDPTASSSTSIVSPAKTGGFANGVLKFIRYIGVGVFSLVSGMILDRKDNEMNDEENRNATWGDFIILLLTLSVLSVAAAVVLIVVNRRSEKRPLSRTKVELEWEDRDEAVQEYTPLSVDFNAKNYSSSIY